jgi:hypothetical protein
MTLAKRLNEMERRIKELERWKSGVDEALVAEEQDEQQPSITLDGDSYDAGERDQTQSLG